MIRVDLHSAAGVKLDYPSVEVETCSYSLALEGIGAFTFTTTANYLATGQQAWIYESTEGLVFKGVIESVTYQADGERRMFLVSGYSVAIELQQRTVGLGLIWEDSPFADAVDDVLADTNWSAGHLDSVVNVPARRMDARQKWDALSGLAQIYNLSVREDNLNAKVDIGAFGESSGIHLTNRRSDILTITDDVAPITSVRVLSRAADIWNRIYPVGQIQGLGGAVLTLSGVSPDNPVATRLYLPSNDGVSNLAPITADYNSDWASTAGANRLTAGLDQVSSAMATEARASAGHHLLMQYVYGPIAAQTIAGNIMGQMRVQEASAALNHQFRINVRVFDSTGTTERGTLLSPSTVGTEFSDVALTNHSIPSTALSSVDAEDGDYVVIEIGRTGGLGQADMRIGDAATTDLTEDQTGTGDLRPWIEFDTYIAPYIAVAATSYPVQSETKNGLTHYYLEDAASVATYGRRDRVLVVKDILPLGLTPTALSQASATLYGAAVSFLERHKGEQVAHEVEAVGLRHYVNGLPKLRVGETLHIDYVGVALDSEGALVVDQSIDADPYLMAFTRTFGPAGESKWALTVSSVLRPLPDDGEVITEMLRDIGIAKISPMGFFSFAHEGGSEKMRLDPYGIQLATREVDSAAIYGLEEFSARPDLETAVWKIVGRVVKGLGLAEVTFSTIDTSIYMAAGVDPVLWLTVAGETVGVFLNDQATGDGRGGHVWLPPIPSLALAYQANTISGGAIVIAQSYAIVDPSPTPCGGFIVVDTEAAAASDSLDNIYYSGTSTDSLRDGQIIVLSAADSARTVSVTEAGNIKLAGGSMSLDNAEDTLTLAWKTGVGWVEIARSNNGA